MKKSYTIILAALALLIDATSNRDILYLVLRYITFIRANCGRLRLHHIISKLYLVYS